MLTPKEIDEIKKLAGFVGLDTIDLLREQGWIVDRQSDSGPVWVDVRSRSSFGYSYEGAISELRRKMLAFLLTHIEEERALLLEARDVLEGTEPSSAQSFFVTMDKIRALRKKLPVPPSIEGSAE